MNWDEIKGSWTELKGKVKQRWGRFTDDDLIEIDGKREQLIGCVQKRYGRAREEAEQEVEEFCGACTIGR